MPPEAPSSQSAPAAAAAPAAAEVTTTAEEFFSDGFALQGQLCLPEAHEGLWLPVLLICQDFPHGRQDASFIDTDFAEQAAQQLGWASFVFSYRGCGKSAGEFSFAGWQRDIASAVDYLWEKHSEEVWLAGFGVGATLGLQAAAANLRVQGVAVAAAYADLEAWTQDPHKLQARLTQLKIRCAEGEAEARAAAASAAGEAGAVTDTANQASAFEAAQQLSPRPLLVMHGQDDEIALPLDARALADAHGLASLRVLEGAGHNLRYDPRVPALLFSWLDRNRS